MAKPPSRSTAVGGTEAKEIFVVQRSVDFGDSAPSPNPPMKYSGIGFDLDGICTAAPDLAMSCASLPNAMPIVDGPGGIDNTFGYFIQQFRNSVPNNFSSEIYSQQLLAGVAANLAVRVTGYDGQPDDDDVQASLLTTAYYQAHGDGGAVPGWAGLDTFPIDSRTVVNGDVDAPRATDPHAYVSGSKLVATLGSIDEPMIIGLTTAVQVRMSLRLEAATLVCTLFATAIGGGGGYNLSCTLGGLWNADDLLHQLSAFPDVTDLQQPRPLCTDSSPYQTFKEVVCLSADVTLGSAPPTAPCDALSFGMNFIASPAHIGNVISVTPTLPSCPAGADPANDSCRP